jgi:hypothetical protein
VGKKMLGQEQTQLLKCPKCGRELTPDDYLCDTCGLCQYCCQCSKETNPEATLPAD